MCLRRDKVYNTIPEEERVEVISMKKIFIKKIRSSIIILVVFILMIICCARIYSRIVWKNTNEMGLSLVKNYSATDEKNINTCEVILNICTNYIAERENTEISMKELRDSFYPFIDGLTDIYGEENIQVYGKLFNGTKLVSNVPEIEAMTDYDFSSTDWYQGAVAANGETYISPLYTDVVTGNPVVTMCKIIPDTGSFLAIDIKLSCFDVNSVDMQLPNKASYYLVDKEGNLLYYLSTLDYERKEIQLLVDSYREDAVCETANHVLENVKASDGIVQNVFFHHMDNDWTGILTIPKDKIFFGFDIFRNISIALISFGIVLIGFQIFREYRNGKKEKEYLEYQSAMNSTIHAYRAIYYIDVQKGSCHTVYPLGDDGKSRYSSYDKEVEDRFKFGVVADEHCEQVFDFLDMSNIKRRLEKKIT